MSMLCKLDDVKTLLNISLEDDSQDAKLTLMIKQASAMIESFCGYSFGRGEYVEELHSVNNRQLLQLNHFPLQSVSSVSANGEILEDWKIIPEYARWGRLYRGLGWSGTMYTRGFTQDVFAGAWEIKVSYEAGYYLPDDENYEEGKEGSLPFDIVSICMQLVIQNYNYELIGAKGLKSHSEGHISESYGDDACTIGLSESAKKALSGYIWVGLA